MDFAEVLKNFTLLDIVHLGPHSYVARDAPKVYGRQPYVLKRFLFQNNTKYQNR